MMDLKIILTACGCPGASTLIRMLKSVKERKITIIGTDIDEEAIGRFMVDKFYKVPPGTSESYIQSMLEIVEKEEPDILFPESSNEVYSLACNKKKFEELGTKVLVSDPEPIKIALDKYLTYEILKRKTEIPLPKYKLVESLDEFFEAIKEIGYPKKSIIFKPPVGKGSRGVRIIDPKINRRDILLKEKPISKYMSLEEFNDIFSRGEFPQLLVMEFLNGPEMTTDTLAMKGRELLTTVKTVEQARWGVIVKGELIRNENLVEQTRKILKAIPLSYCINLQFISNRLIEINPRVSSFIYQTDLIAPYLAIKLSLNEVTEEEIKKYKKKIDYGRRMVRYMDQIFHKKGRRVL